jgi:hypothetical protein
MLGRIGSRQHLALGYNGRLREGQGEELITFTGPRRMTRAGAQAINGDFFFGKGCSRWIFEVPGVKLGGTPESWKGVWHPKRE